MKKITSRLLSIALMLIFLFAAGCAAGTGNTKDDTTSNTTGLPDIDSTMIDTPSDTTDAAPSDTTTPDTTTAPPTETTEDTTTSTPETTPGTTVITPPATTPSTTTTTPPVTTIITPPATTPSTTTTTAPSTTATPPPATQPNPNLSPADADGKFSIAVIPDTQQEVIVAHAINQRYFAQRNEWLVSKKNEFDLRYVLHTGDVVNWGNEDESQFTIASDAMAVLDRANIPVIYSLGNHDTAAVGVGGSAAVPSQTSIRVRDTSAFNKYFSTTRYPYLKVKDAGKVDNAYTTFEAGGVKWLILTLELWAREEVVSWAETVVSSHPDYNVIIMTHSYLLNNGNISTSNGGYGATAPTYVYEKIVKKYSNVKMVFCGHEGTSNVRTDNINGNRVLSAIGGFHSNDSNPVRVVEIDVIKGTISNKIYTPINGQELTQYKTLTRGMKFVGA